MSFSRASRSPARDRIRSSRISPLPRVLSFAVFTPQRSAAVWVGTPVKPSLSAVKSVDFFSSEADKYFNRKTGTFRDGAYAIVTDVATGISYRIKRVGGYNHTDVEPATAFDTWQMYRIYGEEWAWTRHAVLVTLSDGTTLAGSANGMPHGESHISGNNMNGHTCIHFLNSRTHGSDKVDAAHQSAIRTAANCSVSSVQDKVNAQ